MLSFLNVFTIQNVVKNLFIFLQIQCTINMGAGQITSTKWFMMK